MKDFVREDIIDGEGYVNKNGMSQAIANDLEEIIEVIDEVNEVVENEEPQSLEHENEENENAKLESKEKEKKESQSSIDALLMPQEGMEFNSSDEAYNFYNAYALQRGFGTRKASSVYSKGSNILYKRLFVCEKEGTKRLDDPREAGKNVKRRSDTRENCKARMIIKLNKEGKWVVVNFEDIHTHGFASPTKVKKIRSHKNMESACKQLIMDLNDCGIGPSKISRVLNHGGGDVDKVTSRDCRNHLAKARKNNIGGQCMQVLDFFQRKAGGEDGFFFKMEVDANCQVRSFFWADKRSRMTYMQFGDVVVFDVTYNTNSFKMPFAPFTGVNHHRQSTLFGCALLADETTDTFTWLFETWLECMWGKKPQNIITDQDLAMRNAIAKVFPGTQHRFCSWHIGMNAKMHLNHLGQHPDFNKDYNNWRFAETVEESETNWNEMQVKYDIREGSWLYEMYEARSQWINAYFKDYFFAGMTSSQRSESINAFFDGFVNAQTPISEFVQQYDHAIHQRRDEEAYEDHKTLHTKPIMHVGSTLEEQARSVYTRKVFSLFQTELKQSLLYKCKEIGCEGSRKSYEVKKNIGAENGHKVAFKNITSLSAECTCKKFESEGILCRHILRILDRMDIDLIPEKYILFRWTINVRYTLVANLRTMKESHISGVTPYMIYCICSAIYKILDLSSTSPQHWKLAMPKLEVIVEELDRLSLLSDSQEDHNVKTSDVGGSLEATEHLSHIVLRDPSKVKSKGRPRINKRLKSSLEISLSTRSKKRKCSLCQQLGHYMNTCSLYKVSGSQGGQIPEASTPILGNE